MYRILIVDDEPLAQIGMKSMIDYDAIDAETVGVASNGKMAVEMIEQLHPDIVITDIKMPVMSGLELIEYVNRTIVPKPVFIVLTSYEEFEYVRSAMRFNVCDYLVKMELSKEILMATIVKAIKLLEKDSLAQPDTAKLPAGNIFINRFQYRLLDGGFNSEQEIQDNLSLFNMNLDGDYFITAAAEIDFSVFEKLDHNQSYSLFLCVLNTAKVALSMYANNCVVAYNQTTIGFIICLDRKENFLELCEKALAHVEQLCRQYFNVHLNFGVGSQAESLTRLSSSFREAQAALKMPPSSSGIRFYNARYEKDEPVQEINLSSINRVLIKAFENYDLTLFTDTITSLSKQIDTVSLETAIDTVSCIVHLVINCLDNGEQILNEAFSSFPKSYQTLYTCSSKTDIVSYLERLRKGVTDKMEEQRGSGKNKIVNSAKNYIKQHICEKLTLLEVARAIGVSPNYLSSLFTSCCGLRFNDYLTDLKVKKAQALLANGNMKVYQVSEMLGFDNSHYFSKVYKKYTGHSPTETVFMDSGES